MAVFRLNDSGVVWGNQPFWEMCGRTSPAFDAKLASLVPEFNSKWPLEGKTAWRIFSRWTGKSIRSTATWSAPESARRPEFMGITYWVDVTEYDDVKQEYLATRPVVMVMLVDNYDELMKPLTDRQRTELRGQLDIAIENGARDAAAFSGAWTATGTSSFLKSGILTRSRKTASRSSRAFIRSSISRASTPR